MPVSQLAAALIAVGVDAEELIEALTEAAEEATPAKGGKSKGKTEAKGGKGGKADAKGGKGKKKDDDVADLIEDLEDEQVVELLIDLELTTKAKAKKLDRDGLVELLEAAIEEEEITAEEVEETIQDLFEGEEEEEEGYDDMDEEELRALVVKRKVMTKAEAKKADKDDLIDALEEADEEE